MTAFRRMWCVGGMVLAAAMPAPALAQSGGGQPAGLQQILKLGDTAVVTGGAGRQAKGRVVDISADSVTVAGSGDPAWDGALAGAAFGLLPLTLGCDDGGCPAGTYLLNAGIGGGIGFGIDWLVRGTRGSQTFAAHEISDLRRGDALWDGTLIGAAAGVGLAAWAFSSGGSITSAATYVPPAIAGGLAGALIDRAVIIRKIDLAPVLGSGRRGGRLTLRF